MKPIQLDAGQLGFQIRVDGDLIDWTVDLIEAKLVCESVESRHTFKEADGMKIGNVEFFRELGQELHGELGCPVATSSVASHVWGVVTERFISVNVGLNAQLANLD